MAFTGGPSCQRDGDGAAGAPGRRPSAPSEAQELRGQDCSGQLSGTLHPLGDAAQVAEPSRQPDENVAGGAPVAQVLGGERGQPHTVVEQLAPELAELVAVLVPHDRRRLVGDRVPGQDRPDEHVEVLPAAGGGAGTQRLVEPAQGTQHRRPEGEVGAGTELPGGIGVQG